MLIAWLWCLFFGATICLAVPSIHSDQPATAKRLEQFQAAEQVLLQKMGLQSRPRPRRGTKDKVPQFMLDLYHNHINDPEWISTNFRNKGKWTNANTIRAFEHEEDDHLPAPVPGLPANRWNLFFDIASFPNHETLTAAELRLSFSTTNNHTNETVSEKQHRVNIYQVLMPATDGHPATRRLIDTRRTDAQGLESFDIRPAVEQWSLNPDENFGLEVHLVTKGDSSNVHVHSHKEAATDKKPYLVTFSHDGAEHVYTRRRKRRSAGNSSMKEGNNICQRFPMYANFTELGWDDFIIEPPGIDAFYCNGECLFPLSSSLNATNHAILQSLMSLSTKNRVTPTCCGPTTLSPINVLYKNEQGKVVQKAYSDMVVDSCGCR